jgi:hypothetical protein
MPPSSALKMESVGFFKMLVPAYLLNHTVLCPRGWLSGYYNENLMYPIPICGSCKMFLESLYL